MAYSRHESYLSAFSGNASYQQRVYPFSPVNIVIHLPLRLGPAATAAKGYSQSTDLFKTFSNILIRRSMKSVETVIHDDINTSIYEGY